jgi:hypothetical protein
MLRNRAHLDPSPSRTDWFDHDDLGQLFANRQPGIADLANEISLAREQFNDVILTEAKLAQPILNFWSSTELPNPHCDSGFDPAKRA